MNELEAITLEESSRLIQLEAAIHQGKAAFMAVAEALAEIRDSRLYRNQFETFEAYCQSTWGWGRNYVNRMIVAQEAVAQLPENLVPMVTKERVAREVAKVPAEKRAEVVKKAASTGKPVTAKAIKAAAKPEPEPVEEDDDYPGVTPEPANDTSIIDATQARADMLADDHAFLVVQALITAARRSDFSTTSVLIPALNEAMDTLGGLV